MLCVMQQTFHLDGALAAALNTAKVRGQLAGLAVQEWEKEKEGKQGWLPPMLRLLTGSVSC